MLTADRQSYLKKKKKKKVMSSEGVGGESPVIGSWCGFLLQFQQRCVLYKVACCVMWTSLRWTDLLLLALTCVCTCVTEDAWINDLGLNEVAFTIALQNWVDFPDVGMHKPHVNCLKE